MNVENFYATLEFAIGLDEGLQLQQRLEAIRDFLNNLVSAPATPQHQSNLASSIAAFKESASRLSQSISPAQLSVLAQMGGADYFDLDISNKIVDSISSNAMTPSVARDYVSKLASGREQFLETMRKSLLSRICGWFLVPVIFQVCDTLPFPSL